MRGLLYSSVLQACLGKVEKTGKIPWLWKLTHMCNLSKMRGLLYSSSYRLVIKNLAYRGSSYTHIISSDTENHK